MIRQKDFRLGFGIYCQILFALLVVSTPSLAIDPVKNKAACWIVDRLQGCCSCTSTPFFSCTINKSNVGWTSIPATSVAPAVDSYVELLWDADGLLIMKTGNSARYNLGVTGTISFDTNFTVETDQQQNPLRPCCKDASQKGLIGKVTLKPSVTMKVNINIKSAISANVKVWMVQVGVGDTSSITIDKSTPLNFSPPVVKTVEVTSCTSKEDFEAKVVKVENEFIKTDVMATAKDALHAMVTSMITDIEVQEMPAQTPPKSAWIKFWEFWADSMSKADPSMMCL
jgi:hypothetical protein